MPDKRKVESHQDRDGYQLAFSAAMQVFSESRAFPWGERYSLTDQGRKSSRSVCSNIAEAWRKRRYEAPFVSKLNDAEAEAAETQTWTQFAVDCKYLSDELGEALRAQYDQIIGKLVKMIVPPDPWVMQRARA